MINEKVQFETGDLQMNDTNQYLLVNQKTKICTHSKEILIKVQENFVAIVCEKCKIMWSLDGDD